MSSRIIHSIGGDLRASDDDTDDGARQQRAQKASCGVRGENDRRGRGRNAQARDSARLEENRVGEAR
ncbi:hypothetical protein E2562_025763 [Oryza meyeriana var. granulata]|uniref:Uncharacterized protein n=1 Tax=Oryza meyeriana var. granulata TaxID=110450 RepID=A0A6G1CRS9_9ORYZ|nr:hypothetical protein E2562_025763 [Oryza meyeriana var. granulata]